MKKLLLSSIIVLGVCGIASAQTGKMNQKPQANSTSPAALAPQKAAIMPASDASSTAPVATSDDKATGTTVTAVKTTDASSAVTTVNAAGIVVPVNDAQRKETKMAAVKAANAAPKGKQQN